MKSNEQHIKIDNKPRVRRSFMARDMAIHNRSRTFIDRKREANRRACREDAEVIEQIEMGRDQTVDELFSYWDGD